MVACVGMGLHMVFSPQTVGVYPFNLILQTGANPHTAVQMLDIPLPAFHICAMNAPLWIEGAYVGGVAICGRYSFRKTWSRRIAYAPERLLDLATFVCIVAFIKKLRANLGQAHTLSHLMRTLVQDSTIYFFIMLTFNVAMLVYAVMARASLKNFPLV